MNMWRNKVAVITGASSGIGRACCTRLLDEGMIVVGLARRYERMENEFKASLPEDQKNHFHPLKCDVGVEDDIAKAFKWVGEELGGVGVLVNNAGIGYRTQILTEKKTSNLKATLDVNIMGPALCTREAFRSMKDGGIDGHVIMVNSIMGHNVHKAPINSYNMYAPSKFAVTAMTEVLRQEFLLNGTKIKVTSISPGIVATEIVDRSVFKQDVPILEPEDIADAIWYCLQTPPHVQIHELTIKPVGEHF